MSTGSIVLGLIFSGGAYLIYAFFGTLIALASNTLYLAGMLIALGI